MTKPWSNTGDLPSKMGKNEVPKQQMNNTPIRTRDLQNKQNNNLVNNRKQQMQRRVSAQQNEQPTYPYDSLMGSKTVAKRRVSVSPRGCVNHPDNDAEFKIEIEG